MGGGIYGGKLMVKKVVDLGKFYGGITRITLWGTNGPYNEEKNMKEPIRTRTRKHS